MAESQEREADYNLLLDPNTLGAICSHLDILDLASLSCVSHSIKRFLNSWVSPSNIKTSPPLATYRHRVNNRELSDIDAKLHQNYFKAKSANNSPLGPHTAHLLGGLIGVGGTSRVYKLGKLDKVALKVVHGGRHVMGENDCKCDSIFTHHSECKDLDIEKRKFAFLEVLYSWASATTYIVGRLCREHLNGLLLDEYEHLSHINKIPAAHGVFPKNYSFHLQEDLGICYYTMERLEGESLRSIMLKTKATKQEMNDESPQTADFLPAFIKVLEVLILLQFNHCDLKPENVIVKMEGGGPKFQLIDPLPRIKLNYRRDSWTFNTQYIRSFFTVAYNPKGYMGTLGDSFGLAVMMLEMATDSNPFDRYQHNYDWDREMSSHPLSKTLEQMMKQYKTNTFVIWLLNWMINLVHAKEEQVHTEMLAALKKHQESGYKLTRQVVGK